MIIHIKQQVKLAFQTGVFFMLVIGLFGCTPVETKVTREHKRTDFPDVLDITGTPQDIHDFETFFFSDQGAWFGFSLPDIKKTDEDGLGFVGPFLLSHGSWLATSLANLEILQSHNGTDFKPVSGMTVNTTYYPGLIRINSQNEDINVAQELCFADANTAMIKVEVKNLSQDSKYIKMNWRGQVWMEGVELSSRNQKVYFHMGSSSDLLTLNFPETQAYHSDIAVSNSYEMEGRRAQMVKPGASYQETVTLTYTSAVGQAEIEALEITPLSSHQIEEIFNQNELRWDGYINAILSEKTTLLQEPEYQQVAVKALETMILNWRAPRGALRHGGLFPSAAVWYFNGFWGWDSWKHVVALARFAPEIAEEQILTMFDFQDEHGMIADCIYADSTENNWRNTKPPLAAWAVSELYDHSQNLEFVRAIYPRLVKYHQWWYEHRDHDQNGLCEYGCTDGTLVAAKWESGVDDGIHYDSSKVLQNNATAWSLDQESVDLNSYLYLEKLYLAKLSELLNDENTAKNYTHEAGELKDRIRVDMFDAKTGFFYDVGIFDRTHIPVYGPQGWIPLWTGVASKEQASAVRNKILDPEHFSTYIPFPTVSKSNPAYLTGYWRGPVWLDQVYFGISGLRKYGYEEDAIRYTRQVLDRCEGLKGAQGPIRENYNPETGEGMKVNHFSWSAAHLLMMLWEM